MKKQAATGWP